MSSATESSGFARRSPFFRRWHIEASQPHTGVTLNFSFASGFSEHSIHIRGSLASATADFERNTYVLAPHTPSSGWISTAFSMVVSEANALKRQAWHSFAHVVPSKAETLPR